MDGIRGIFQSLSITGFLEEIDRHNFIWFIKRLSGNDTGLTGGHQVGLYLPGNYVRQALPEIYTRDKYNPDIFLDCYMPNNDILIKNLRAIYYNSRFFPEKGLKKKYNEFRVTRWGGRANPVQDPENTGSICIFAISKIFGKPAAVVWVASSVEEENAIETWLGEEVEPGRIIKQKTGPLLRRRLLIPEEWQHSFPSGREIFQHVVNHLPRHEWTNSIDELLLRRRQYEFYIFSKIEERDVLPNIQLGFQSVDEFIKYAHSVSNRRKSRSGTSLELHLASLFSDEKIMFETQVTTENRKKPDFLFPSGRAYHDRTFPAVQLNMLASKTCCKDRWRQILNEADRINPKHLFTLQEGVSNTQLQEMKDNNVKLVIPAPNLKYYSKGWRDSLQTLGGFIDYIKSQQIAVPDLGKWIS